MSNEKPHAELPKAIEGIEKIDATSFSSPACLAHEMDSRYAGYLSDAELIELLNLLLEGERAGDKVARAFRDECPSAETRLLLEAVERDEARFAAMLARFVEKLGGQPSQRVSTFYERAMAVEGFKARLDFLNRGQAWVVRKLSEALPRTRDDRIHAGLKGMLGAHETNIARCQAAIETLA